MTGPLWIETHSPTIADLPQASVRQTLERFVDEPMNLLLYGPPGSGKTAAVRALARAAHANSADLVEINVADFFGLTKRELGEDPRFAGFITPRRRRESSKAALINHVLTELASHPPVAGTYKTICLDNAEAMRGDFQQALRRVMERHHRTTRFVLTTRRPAQVLAPILSRCVPVRVRAPTTGEIAAVLERIVEAEGVTATADGIEYVAGYAGGDLRRAILSAQTIATTTGEITMESAYETLGDIGADDRIEEMLVAAASSAFTDARAILDELLIDEGIAGGELLDDTLRVARSRYRTETLARVHRLAGDVDLDITTGVNDRIHLSRFLAELADIESTG